MDLTKRLKEDPLNRCPDSYLNKIKDLISEGSQIYNQEHPKAYDEFLKWIDSSDNAESRNIKIKILDYVQKGNKSSNTVLYKITQSVEQDMLEKILSNNPLHKA